MIYDVIIVGSGQAGLSMGYYLKQTKLTFLILDKGLTIGEAWRNRYDSLTLFTPVSYSSLPGLELDCMPNHYPTKDEIADYLTKYAETFSLPILLNTYISKLEKTTTNFLLTTNRGDYTAKQVVIATGPFQHPYIPEFSRLLSDQVLQLHSSNYKNPKQLKQGPALVVGGGNSGSQIAVELSNERNVYLSVGHKLKFLPQDLGNKSIFWWFDKLGILKIHTNSKFGEFLKEMPDPIFGYELKSLLKNGKITLKPRAKSVVNDHIVFEDNSKIEAANIIWSTGFKGNYGWIHTPSVFDKKGVPIHQRGVTSIRGLFFLGLPWQYRRGSALLQGVGRDAEYLMQQVLLNTK